MIKRIIALGSLCAVAACSGRGGTSAPVAPTAASIPQSATASFTIAVPNAASAASNVRSAEYISSSTQSVIITLAQVNGANYSGASPTIATNLTSSNPACSSATGTLTCAVRAPAVAGSDAFTVTTYDAQQTSSAPATPAGNLLSTGTVNLTVVAGQANAPTALVLNGVASTIAATFGSDPHISGSQNAGYSIVGSQPYTLTMSAKDGSGATIIGAGAPTFTVTSGSSTVKVVSSGANTASVRVASNTTAPVNLTITPSQGTAATVAVKAVQELWVLLYNNPAGYSVNAYALAAGGPAQITSDSITTGLDSPASLALDSAGNLWIAECRSDCGFSGPDAVVEYVPGTGVSSTLITAGIFEPQGVAFDPTGHMWVTSVGGNQVTEYAPPANTVIATLGSGLPADLDTPYAVALDGSGNVWVASYLSSPSGNGTVKSYPATNGASSTATITSGINNPVGMVFDGQHLWVSNTGNNSLAEYATSNGATPLATITVLFPQQLALDAAGNLWVGSSAGYVYAFTPTNGATPIAADTINLNPLNPYGVAIAP